MCAKNVKFQEFITTRFPNLTEMDIQYCILIKLHFTVSQIAVLSAISPTSVYQQKSRMKKRIQTLEPELFTDGSDQELQGLIFLQPS